MAWTLNQSPRTESPWTSSHEICERTKQLWMLHSIVAVYQKRYGRHMARYHSRGHDFHSSSGTRSSTAGWLPKHQSGVLCIPPYKKQRKWGLPGLPPLYSHMCWSTPSQRVYHHMSKCSWFFPIQMVTIWGTVYQVYLHFKGHTQIIVQRRPLGTLTLSLPWRIRIGWDGMGYGGVHKRGGTSKWMVYNGTSY